ncbi:MAG: hypothetical protein WBW93_05375 [Steroidobacteraceae bacterium]
MTEGARRRVGARRTELGGKRYDALVAAGIIEPAAEPGLAMTAWPNIEVPSGTVAQLIDADRGER